MFSGGKPPDLLCYLSDTINDIGNIVANVEGVVIITFLIGLHHRVDGRAIR